MNSTHFTIQLEVPIICNCCLHNFAPINFVTWK